MSWPRFAGLTFILALPTLARPAQAAQQTVRVTGLARNGDWQLVRANCTECHSALLITQNSGNRGVWQSRIAWMQETQGMAQLDPDVEESILAYLSRRKLRPPAIRPSRSAAGASAAGESVVPALIRFRLSLPAERRRRNSTEIFSVLILGRRFGLVLFNQIQYGAGEFIFGRKDERAL